MFISLTIIQLCPLHTVLGRKQRYEIKEMTLVLKELIYLRGQPRKLMRGAGDSSAVREQVSSAAALCSG